MSPDAQVVADVAVIAAALRRYRYPVGREAELQCAVARALDAADLSAVAQAQLSAADRVDFLVDGGIVVELKTDGSLQLVALQLLRYASLPTVRALVLATTRHRHAFLPSEMNGKPLAVVVLRVAW